MKSNRVARILQAVMLLLCLTALTACSPDRVILQGNQAVLLQQNESAPWQGWLIQPEAIARILEKAEACQQVKGNK